jgi:PhoPQ-activated pathogenicity-related protein
MARKRVRVVKLEGQHWHRESLVIDKNLFHKKNIKLNDE